HFSPRFARRSVPYPDILILKQLGVWARGDELAGMGVRATDFPFQCLGVFIVPGGPTALPPFVDLR
ncbi:hypothetical protein, partial [Sphingosinicella sp. CPCC 101087]|uniref:hypothetical protein n=1 Tax=Sphingosinicella sp. CPCC 101087 TaxID=2497754 RepID=UPI00197D17BF